MKFYSRFGRICRYKFGDVVIFKNNPKEHYVVINAKWIGNSNGFWKIWFKNIVSEKEFSILRPKNLKKIGSILGGKVTW